jgi:adenylosuccinate lyase
MSLPLSPLTAVSPLDGRYARQTEPLRACFSEYALIRARVQIEVAWLHALAAEPAITEIPALGQAERAFLDAIVRSFSPTDAERVKAIEATTNHDVKAVEYFLKERLDAYPALAVQREFVHFACTSEDINNLAYALLVQQARQEILLPSLHALVADLNAGARRWAGQPMLARTHGQPASPTTVGKELRNLAVRLERQVHALASVSLLGKINGAVGNFNAHQVAYPEVDWPALGARLIHGLGLEPNSHTTQIEPHDALGELFHALMRINAILLDASRDFWGYISLGYFRQRVVEGEVGSSTMPHKVNPIDFENAEGNLGMANALLGHFAEKLPISRFQRDLSDSTVLRNIGVAFGWSLLAYRSMARGFAKLEIDADTLRHDLESNWEVLAEAIQTVMRRHGVEAPYEKLKAVTRGQRVTPERLREFIQTLDIPETARERLLALSPAGYTGLAADLASPTS